MEIITLIIIGLSLSIDAFTLSLAYGLLSVSKRKIILTSLTVGVFHFIMPITGYSLGNAIENYIKSLGMYKTKEKAMKVLDELQCRIARSESSVFQMPEED